MAPEAIEQLRQALKLMRSNLMTDDREPQA